MLLLSCSLCETKIKFNTQLNYLSCPSCRHMFKYTADQLLDLGKCPVETDPEALLQVADKGDIRGRSFEVEAAIYLAEEPDLEPLDYWTEWVLRLADGRVAHLAEYDGFLYYEASRFEPIFTLPPFEALKVGDVIDVDGHKMTISELSSGILLGFDGSIKFPNPGQRLQVAEAFFRNYEAYIEYFDGKVFVSYAMAFPLDSLVIEERGRLAED